MSCACDMHARGGFHCRRCCRTFSGIRGFDLHQRLDDSGRVHCLDPATMMRPKASRALFVRRGDTWAVDAWNQGAAPNWSEISQPTAGTATPGRAGTARSDGLAATGEPASAAVPAP